MTERPIASLIEDLQNLRLKENAIIAEIEARLQVSSASAPTLPTQKIYLVGDRIRITNRVRRPLNWIDSAKWCEEQAKTATVVRVGSNRLHLVTDNGVHTWRVLHNVQPLENEQCQP